MERRWRSPRRFAWILLAVAASGCRASEKEEVTRPEEPSTVEVEWGNGRRRAQVKWGSARWMQSQDRSSPTWLEVPVEGIPCGWQARLRPRVPQGINPQILLLSLDVFRVRSEGAPRDRGERVEPMWVQCFVSPTGIDEIWFGGQRILVPPPPREGD